MTWHTRIVEGQPKELTVALVSYTDLLVQIVGFIGWAIVSSLPADLRASVTSSSVAPRLISMVSCRGSMWFMFALRLLTPVTFLGPVISTKFLSVTSTTTHFFPASRPRIFMHILPTSAAVGKMKPL